MSREAAGGGEVIPEPDRDGAGAGARLGVDMVRCARTVDRRYSSKLKAALRNRSATAARLTKKCW
jgi:dUTPase